MDLRRITALTAMTVLMATVACSAGGDGGTAEDREEATIRYDDENYLYVSDESPSVDEESRTSYFPHMLNVFMTAPADGDDAQRIAEAVDGEVVGQITGGMDMIQVLLDAPDLPALERAQAELLALDAVQFVSPEHPVGLTDDLGTPPHGAFDGATNGLLPRELLGGGRWWVEAIGADEVWQAREEYPEAFEGDVALSVFEQRTIDVEHVDTGDEHREEWEDAGHTMTVARFAAAGQDTDGVTGVGQPSTLLSHSIRRDSLPRKLFSPFTRTSQLTYALKKAVEEAHDAGGNVVVNVSAGHSYCSAEGWKDPKTECPADADVDTFEEYQAFAREDARASAAYFARGLVQLKEKGLDPLIVQAAGNGPTDVDFTKLEPLPNPPDARSTGFFAGIDESLFDEVCPPDDCPTTFEETVGSIIVVGALDRAGADHEASRWSHTGDRIDVLAPGSLVAAPWEDKEKTGTSFATPMVSGTAATIWSMDPSLTASEVKEVILAASEEDLSRDGHTYPTLNSWGAISATAESLGLDFRDKEERLLDLYDEYLDEDSSFLPSESDETDYFGWWPGTEDFEGDPSEITHSYTLRDITHDGYPELITSARAMDFEYSRVFSAIPSGTGVEMVEYAGALVWGAASAGGGRVAVGTSSSQPGIFEFSSHSLSPTGEVTHLQYSHDDQFEGSVTSESLGEFESPTDVVPDFDNLWETDWLDRADRSALGRG